MLGHYGWLIPRQEICHPEAARHQGRVYVKARDVLLPRDARPLTEGDRVEFYLYAEDGHGLGAEECRLVGSAEPAATTSLPSQWAFPDLSWSSVKRPRPSASADGGKRLAKGRGGSGWNVDAPEFVCSKPLEAARDPVLQPEVKGWNVLAAEFVPERADPEENICGLRPSAAEFVPGAVAAGEPHPDAAEFVPMGGGIFDPDEWLTDDEDGSDDERKETAPDGAAQFVPRAVDAGGLRPSAKEFVPTMGAAFDPDEWLTDDEDLADDEGGSEDDRDPGSAVGAQGLRPAATKFGPQIDAHMPHNQSSGLTSRIAQIFKADACLSDDDGADSSCASTTVNTDGGGDDSDSGCSIASAAPNKTPEVFPTAGKELAAHLGMGGAGSTASTTDSEGGSPCASDAEAPAAPQAAHNFRLPPGLRRSTCASAAQARAAPRAEPSVGPPPGLPPPSLRVFRSSLLAVRSELYALSY